MRLILISHPWHPTESPARGPHPYPPPRPICQAGSPSGSGSAASSAGATTSTSASACTGTGATRTTSPTTTTSSNLPPNNSQRGTPGEPLHPVHRTEEVLVPVHIRVFSIFLTEYNCSSIVRTYTRTTSTSLLYVCSTYIQRHTVPPTWYAAVNASRRPGDDLP